MSVTPAPLRLRTPAFLVDQLVVLVAVCLPVVLSGVSFSALLTPGDTRTIVFLLLMAAAFLYHFLFEWQTGETIGKRLFGLTVVSDDGTALGFRGSFLRNALRLIDGLGYWSVAVAVILYRGDGKRIGDVVGRTIVVRR
ncbi:RDD family protein [Natronocalculus amylovorans]|uniref:RDD family protein n=1 Tax=Natronocalculus amylovorans TaxID=2917812 RepID=A0AAE3FWX4_9EURY|nr:RDD family protein [Natronocalculus amylovorans]MCL9816184.1 RDD family protein [Natronocalculus amylovorans]